MTPGCTGHALPCQLGAVQAAGRVRKALGTWAPAGNVGAVQTWLVVIKFAFWREFPGLL